MSKFAPVVPAPIAQWMQGDGVGEDLLGDYHLLLAHDVVANANLYKKVYSEVRKRWKDSFIILDNSVVELGDAVGNGVLFEAAKIVLPDCIVVPDVMGDGIASRYRAQHFCREYTRAVHEDEVLNRLHIPLMGVIHGRDLDDCLGTAFEYWCTSPIDYVGIPRVLTKMLGSRMPVLQSVLRSSYFRGVHLLGFSDNLLDDVSCARMKGVGGIDSAVPIRAALQGQRMTLDVNKDYGPRGDFWNSPVDLIKRRAVNVTDNIIQIRNWIGGTE